MNDTARIIRPKKNSFDIFVKTAIIIIAAVSILAAIKCIIVGLQRDEEYALSLSYRLINGDKLLTQVWDPHQTSFIIDRMDIHQGHGRHDLPCFMVQNRRHFNSRRNRFLSVQNTQILRAEKHLDFTRPGVLWHSSQGRNYS